MLLEDAVGRLPAGDYSTGLNAIARHVKAAIRHLERDKAHDPDTCTDAIYRMNQAYEGSLKEAYRVLADKDPAGKTPSQIENYLETHNVVRPRVLTQLTRYRQDYRNPSTHDYKLDFDEDEALLAIVSVCAFATLLTNQIASRLAANAAQARVEAKANTTPAHENETALEQIVALSLAYTRESAGVKWFEFEQGLAATLNAAGHKAVVAKNSKDSKSNELCDVRVDTPEGHLSIFAQVSPSKTSENRLTGARIYELLLDQSGVHGALVIQRSSLGNDDYESYSGKLRNKTVFLIADDYPPQIELLGEELDSFKKLS